MYLYFFPKTGEITLCRENCHWFKGHSNCRVNSWMPPLLVSMKPLMLFWLCTLQSNQRQTMLFVSHIPVTLCGGLCVQETVIAWIHVCVRMCVCVCVCKGFTLIHSSSFIFFTWGTADEFWMLSGFVSLISSWWLPSNHDIDPGVILQLQACNQTHLFIPPQGPEFHAGVRVDLKLRITYCASNRHVIGL